jgi:polyisoprenoid-binding protein YceI
MTSTASSPVRPAAARSTWSIDQMHSTVEFAVKHMMVSTVKGRFREFRGTLDIDEQSPERSKVEADIDVASIDTGVEMRDNDLRSDNFFSAQLFPKIVYRSRDIELVDGGHWKLQGDLTIRDITRPVSLDVEFEGRGPDGMGGERAGFTATTKVSRKEFGIAYNPMIEAGGVVVGDTVKITLNVEAIRQGQARSFVAALQRDCVAAPGRAAR